MTTDITAAMVAARRAGRRAPLPASIPEDRAAAYAAQIATFEALGLGVAGFKVGSNGRTGEPAAAPLAAGTIHRDKTRITVSEAHPLWLEAELAFVMGRDLPARSAPYAADEVLAAVEGVAAAIEIVDPRFADWPAIPPMAAFADFQANGATVVSSVGRGAGDLKVEELTVDFRMGDLVKTVPGTKYPGEDAVRLLVWLANNVGLWGATMTARGLRAGDVVISGSWTSVDKAVAGTTASNTIAGVGSVAVEIVQG
ncbi:fumarylacetoacetate hydrolase family protein [Thalassobaculum sp.]|uniref:fumarylacetoacetate hydrolase family protein n=1 Tax=Thalassobaculum sp. TaxID=2022740 RepID=UPI0032F00D19